jgi:hypothetical protein
MNKRRKRMEAQGYEFAEHYAPPGSDGPQGYRVMVRCDGRDCAEFRSMDAALVWAEDREALAQ